jgi:DNA-binding CsgD family transcriptional regulator
MLTGRGAERAQLDRLSATGRTGQSAVLVLRGEPGIGKTALLDDAAQRADDWRVLRTAGVESEMELPFAGIQQLSAALLDRLDQLPAPQRDALAIAFGLSSGAPPNRFLVGLAILSLLANAAEDRPLLCLVDDAQWLDRSSAQVLAFVAQRLQAESVVLLFAERDPAEVAELARLPELRVHGLPDTSARELLRSVVSGPLDERVRDRILTETRGNPLALLELPREAMPAGLAGGFAVPGELPLPARLEASFRQRVRRLPDDTQLLLLVAAAEPTGEPALLWRAAAEFGVPVEAAAPAEADGLIEFGARIAFRHSLLRSAIYRAAVPAERRRVHRALAAATDAETDPDRRAWHRAHSTLAPDEDIAAELVRSGERAQARGGLAATAAFLQRAVALTPDAGRRARRALAAARASQLCGASQTALALLGTASAGPLDEVDQALLQRLRGKIALDLRRGGEAVPMLLDAAGRLEKLDPGRARETYLEALRAASVAGRLGDALLSTAEAARRAPPPAGPPRAVDLLLDGLAVRFSDGYAASAPALHRALAAVREEDGRAGHDLGWPWLARRVAPDLFDDETWHTITSRNIQIARDAGALAILPLAINAHSTVRIFAGSLDAATVLLDEADAIADATGTAAILFGRPLLAAYRGDQERTLALIEAGESAAIARGEGVVLTFGELATSVLHNGLGHYEAALGPAQQASARDELMASAWALPELVEAASRCGMTKAANTALEELTQRTRAAGSALALGIEARSRALLCAGDAAEQCYRQAVQLLGGTRMPAQLARAHLLHGEWLRREHRRAEAREPLRTAHDMFTTMGMTAFAERTRRELNATGETVRKRNTETHDELTAQEAQIVQLARAGHTNSEIGAELFISPRTVEWHLRKVFTKLGVTSRKGLRAAAAVSHGPGSPRVTS